MSWLQQIIVRLRSIIYREEFEAELDDEISFHIDMQTEQLVKSGMSPDAARTEAMRAFGGVEQFKEGTRDVRGVVLMETIWQDIRYGFRMLGRSPAFTIVAVVTLALGIGANTAIFSVVNSVLLRPLPYPSASQIVMLWQANPTLGYEEDQVAVADLHAWQEESQLFSRFGFVVNDAPGTRNHVFHRDNQAERIRGRFASAGLFDVLGIPPLIGRVIEEEEYKKGAERVAVLSHAFWQRAFNGDPEVIGQTLHIEPMRGKSVVVVGVMPPEFAFPQDCDAWFSFSGHPFHKADRLVHECWVVGRMKPGVNIEEATAELDVIQGRLAQEHPDAPQVATHVKAVPILEQFTGSSTKSALLLLMATVGVVLLIACANVANLLLARAASRRKEIAVRISLGAGRVRVIRQLLTEGLLLAIFGAVLGIGVAHVGINLLPAMTTSSGGGIKEFRVDRFDGVELDPFVLGFTLLVSVSTSVLFGLAPALQASRLNLNEALKEEGRGSTDSAGRHRVRNFLLVSEVSMAMLLVVWAGLTVQSFRRVMDIDLGFTASHVMTATIDPDVALRMYDGNRHQLIRQIVDKVIAVPGVESAAVIGELGTRRSGANWVLHIDGQPEVPVSELPTIDGRAISPEYFETLGIPLLSGRLLTEDDNLEAPPVVMINETVAKRYFPNRDPVGQKIITGHPAFPIMNQPKREIVGIVGDVRTFSTEAEVQPEVFTCYRQKNPRFFGGGETVIPFLIRTREKPVESINAIRFAIEGNGSSGRILGNVDSMGRLLDVTAGQHRFRTLLMSLFAGLALLLATVGIYGVMSYGVSQRTHEIGVRMALGAQSGDVLKMIIVSGMKLCFVGIVIGLGLAAAGGQLLASMLYGIEPLDLPTLVGVSVVLALTGFLACYIPARRALRIHPMEALRYE